LLIATHSAEFYSPPCKFSPTTDKDCTNDNYFIIRMFKLDDSSKVKYAPTFKKQKGVAEGTYKKQLHAYVRSVQFKRDFFFIILIVRRVGLVHDEARNWGHLDLDVGDALPVWASSLVLRRPESLQKVGVGELLRVAHNGHGGRRSLRPTVDQELAGSLAGAFREHEDIDAVLGKFLLHHVKNAVQRLGDYHDGPLPVLAHEQGDKHDVEGLAPAARQLSPHVESQHAALVRDLELACPEGVDVEELLRTRERGLRLLCEAVIWCLPAPAPRHTVPALLGVVGGGERPVVAATGGTRPAAAARGRARRRAALAASGGARHRRLGRRPEKCLELSKTRRIWSFS
jgi:hypothetical protein